MYSLKLYVQTSWTWSLSRKSTVIFDLKFLRTFSDFQFLSRWTALLLEDILKIFLLFRDGPSHFLRTFFRFSVFSGWAITLFDDIFQIKVPLKMVLHKKYDQNHSEMRCIFRLKVYSENILQKSMFYFVHSYSTKMYFTNVPALLSGLSFLWMYSALNDFRLFCDILGGWRATACQFHAAPESSSI